jgi:hypothetical protein
MSDHRNDTIALSNRQYTLLKMLEDAPSDKLTLEELSGLNQLTVGANWRRKWLQETADRRSVRITALGRRALRSFENGVDISRKVHKMQFSHFLSLDVYDDETETPRKKHHAA